MSQIFYQGQFKSYAVSQLNEARSVVTKSVGFSRSITTVFISHKHEDLEDLKGVIGFLERNYNVKIYIDSRDPSMPEITSAKTAETIKERITNCNKFILLATNKAIESKWCNWELGFGDAKKYKDHIAIFPMKPQGTFDSQYKGSEYMDIYPYITYTDGTEKYSNGTYITKGYYVIKTDDNRKIYTPLANWFEI